MRKPRLKDTLSFRVSEKTRAAIESLASNDEQTIGETARELLALGIKARAGADI
ncbi:hypothetical protein [Dehalobacter sp. MCB1]|uniref:hypothetical protein n=1 Tax=Dehalobacter sp. MCB1 TaxID=1844756 RepID=UPI001314A5F2|nr:hypothetical protein [Dehalobacter sp. MCB1]